jgi:membrane-anchored mycosin MYCP
MLRTAALIAATAALTAVPAVALARAAAPAPAATASPSATPSQHPTPRPTASGKHGGGGGGGTGNGGGGAAGPQPAGPGPLTPVPITPAARPTRNCNPTAPSFATRITKQPWAQRALAPPSVWSLAQGSGVTVAVVDSGVDYSPQLAGRVKGISLIGGGNRDCAGHGTVVAGIIAASDLRKQGIPFTGIAPQARILSVRVNQGRQGKSQTLAQGIRDAATLGARVINVSIVTGNSPVLAAAVKYALSRNAVIVAAGGNDETAEGGQVLKGPFYPASYPGVISVGAVNAGGGLAKFSDQRSHVAVTAPGVNLVSTFPGGYGKELNGTSFSTAFVSGVAALVRSRYPHLRGPAVVQRIEATADGPTGPGTGNGMVNPLQAVTAVLPAASATASPPAAAPGSVPVATAPVPPPLPTGAALAITGGALAGALVVALGAVVITRGRRRRWRAARAEIPADDST